MMVTYTFEGEVNCYFLLVLGCRVCYVLTIYFKTSASMGPSPKHAMDLLERVEGKPCLDREVLVVAEALALSSPKLPRGMCELS